MEFATLTWVQSEIDRDHEFRVRVETHSYFFATLSAIPSDAGNYELTLVVESTGVQWSEDPEFDTTGN